ncbi:cytochrome P450 family protein [Streptomyces iranensis]|uniref:Cytochrome P450 n=1 Tax=Streptomyces iranensis TaxID=576784 RepID=A0A061ABF7_9ACTN|nr:cytochrome P450 [Streptomyces iranensis]MBP2060625.1 cytochrome P450 [Streptomyces iranensis]CDR16931.1 cytochrome P450 [Streptomyces iranensis]
MTDSTGADTSGTGTSAEADLLSWDFIQDPYLTYREMRAGTGPRRLVIKTLSTGLHAWLVTEYSDVRRLLADPRLSKAAGGAAPIIAKHSTEDVSGESITSESMLFSDPPQHSRLRRMFSRAFTMRRTQNLRTRIEELTDQLLGSIPTGTEIDLVESVAMAIPIAVIGELLGVPRAAHHDLRRWNRTLTSVDSEPSEKYRAYMASLEYFRNLITEKMRSHDTADDLINAMINPDNEERFDESELLSTIFLMMNAGYETTANLISSSVYALLTHPEQLELLRGDATLIPNAVEEFLRYESPLNLSTLRYTTEPVEIGDTVVPAGEVVFLALCSANRDPDRFAEPDRLDIRRNAATHLAFGHGIHHCVGAPLARLEGEIVLARLLDKFPHWEAAEPLDRLSWRYTLQFRGLERLPVKLHA